MRPLPTGIYTPLPCFFKQNEDLGNDPILPLEFPNTNELCRPRGVSEPCKMYVHDHLPKTTHLNKIGI